MRVKTEIRTTLSQVQSFELIFNEWGLGERVKYGRGIIMLFSGEPGTGKTMMAEAIAHYLSREFWTINYAQLQNCYLGKTEKNIQEVFIQGKKSGAVILFDEADSFIYNRENAIRSYEVSHVNVFLQEMENYDGVVILNTNNKFALDRALERRLALRVNFPLPKAEARESIWKFHFPPKVPLAGDIDFKTIAQKYDLTGGEIKNIALRVIRQAASRNNEQNQSIVTFQDIENAIRIERRDLISEKFKKIGFN